MITIEVGKPFPGAYPQNDALVFEVGPDGTMTLMIQMKAPSPAEASALQAGFTSYSWYEAPDDQGCWVWKFPAPLGYMDSPFNAGMYQDDRIEKLLSHPEWNMLQVYVLDGPIVKIVRASGLQPEAVAAFQATIRRQLQTGPRRDKNDASVDALYRMKSKEIYQRGKQFKHQ